MDIAPVPAAFNDLREYKRILTTPEDLMKVFHVHISKASTCGLSRNKKLRTMMRVVNWSLTGTELNTFGRNVQKAIDLYVNNIKKQG